ncbi:MAG: aminotransferase class I/II-fold pyridoxal phosphate-dependent enzyme [Thermoplasmata archaeon]
MKNNAVDKFFLPSARVSNIQSAVIQDIFALIKRNRGTLSLSQGVPFFGPPPESLEYLSNASKEPVAEHGYGPDAGEDELRETLGKKLLEENSIDVDWKRQVIITAGANQAFFNILMAVGDEGDEIIIFSPYYFNHEMAIRMAGLKPVVVRCRYEDEFLPKVNEIRKAISRKTKAIVTVSPSNPTGKVWPPSLLKEINRLCKKEGIFHISDETYEYFTFDKHVHYSPGSAPGASDYTFSIFSFSKAYGIPGWRLGYYTFPSYMYEDMIKIQDSLVICPSPLLQRAVLAGLNARGRSWAKAHLKEMERSRKVLLKQLRKCGIALDIIGGEGGYYLYIRIKPDVFEGYGEGKNSTIEKQTSCTNIKTPITSKELMVRLIEDYKIAVVPGYAFGMDDLSLRVSFGNLTGKKIGEAAERLLNGLAWVMHRAPD